MVDRSSSHGLPADPAGLDARGAHGREREVLGLMAEGLTDRGIASRLFVTPKTVETDVHHIFTKLGLPATAADNKRVHAVLAYLSAN